MKLTVINGILTGLAAILTLKAMSATYLYAILILVVVAASYGVLTLVADADKNGSKFRMPKGQTLYAILIGSVVIGLASGLLAIRLLFV
jgi:hypothetical protein